MSIWKRGVNLVKGAIAEASKPDDPEKIRVLDEEMKTSSASGLNTKKSKKNDFSIKMSEETSENSSQECPAIDLDKTLTPKKRTI